MMKKQSRNLIGIFIQNHSEMKEINCRRSGRKRKSAFNSRYSSDFYYYDNGCKSLNKETTSIGCEED